MVAIRTKPLTAAFTLVELLVCCTLFMVLATLLFNAFNITTHVWQREQRATTQDRELRLTVQLLRRDLQHAVVGDDTPFLLNPDPSLVFLPVDPQTSSADSFCFFTRHPAAGKSDLCAVAYYLDQHHQLQRCFVDSDHTWQSAGANHGLLAHMLDPTNSPLPRFDQVGQSAILLHHITGLQLRQLSSRLMEITLYWQSPGASDQTFQFQVSLN